MSAHTTAWGPGKAPLTGAPTGVNSKKAFAAKAGVKAAAEVPPLTAGAVVRWLIKSLYVDEALPRGTLLHWLLQTLLGVKLTHKKVRDLMEEAGVRMAPAAPKRLNFYAVLEEPPPGFRGFSSEGDFEPSQLEEKAWEEVKSLLAAGGWHKAEDPSHKVFVVASWLQDSSDLLRSISFGRMLCIVRCGVSTFGLLGHRASLLVPYAESEERERRLNAVMGQPTHVNPDEKFVRNWDELKAGLRRLLEEQPEGWIETSKLKLSYRASFGTELSETVFGHESLSKMLGDPSLGDEFVLESAKSSRATEAEQAKVETESPVFPRSMLRQPHSGFSYRLRLARPSPGKAAADPPALPRPSTPPGIAAADAGAPLSGRSQSESSEGPAGTVPATPVSSNIPLQEDTPAVAKQKVSLADALSTHLPTEPVDWTQSPYNSMKWSEAMAGALSAKLAMGSMMWPEGTVETYGLYEACESYPSYETYEAGVAQAGWEVAAPPGLAQRDSIEVQAASAQWSFHCI